MKYALGVDQQMITADQLWSLEFASDSSLLIRRRGDGSDDVVNADINRAYQAIMQSSVKTSIENLHPAYSSLLIDFDPIKIFPVVLIREIENQLQAISKKLPVPAQVHEVPVHYGGGFGPDLKALAEHSGLSVGQVVRLHSSTLYTVAFLGFSPGFPYLSGLPEKLHCPRLATPRLKVPRGSVAIGGTQTGIYPQESPGGWQIIGRTDLELFNPSETPCSLFQPGDRIRFVPINIKNLDGL